MSVNRLSVREAPAKSNYDLSVNGLTLDDVKQSTAILTSEYVFTGTKTKPIVTPIYHASTYVMEKLEDNLEGIIDGAGIYSRLGNPTSEAAEATINAIERGAGSLTFASGMAAVTSVFLGFLSTGDHVIIQVPCYPGTATTLKHMKEHYGIEVSKVKNVVVEEVEKLVRPNTKLLWVESPCNPEILVLDIEKLAEFTRSKNILLGVDGTFASPVLQHIMPCGVDFAMHSCTKYIGGHSDLIGGCVTTRTVEQWRVLKQIQGTFGNMLSPHDCSLLHRGLKTLDIRMERISANGLKVATYLEQHPKVQRVRYPFLKSHPHYQIAKKQMSGGSGMIMAEIKGGEKGGRAVAENVRVIRMAVSLGGVDSILEHPYSMTHGPYLFTPEETEEAGVTPGMLRISIGLEDADDLIKDLEQALDKLVL